MARSLRSARRTWYLVLGTWISVARFARGTEYLVLSTWTSVSVPSTKYQVQAEGLYTKYQVQAVGLRTKYSRPEVSA